MINKYTFKEILEIGKSIHASDIHIKTDELLAFRKFTIIISYPKYGHVTEEDINDFINEVVKHESKKQILDKEGSLDISYGDDELGYYRINIYRYSGKYAMVIRILPSRIPTLKELGLPDIMDKFTEFQNGIILITGPTGSGKSTTLASMIDRINEKEAKNIITIEDPIEYRYKTKKSIISQREIGIDTKDFASALRGALRQDPDVILVGELRDEETINIALTAAETGHLVLSTVHTNSVSKTVDRLVSSFDSSKQSQIATSLATSLRAVVGQQLVPSIDGNSVVCATEVVIINKAAESSIRDKKYYQLESVIQTGRLQGMHSYEDSFASLVKQGKISVEQALRRCKNPEYFFTVLNRNMNNQNPNNMH